MVPDLPKYSIPRQKYVSPFEVKKEQLRPNIGPNTYVPKTVKLGSSVMISDSRLNRSTIDIRRAMFEKNIGPGYYKLKASVFDKTKEKIS